MVAIKNPDNLQSELGYAALLTALENFDRLKKNGTFQGSKRTWDAIDKRIDKWIKKQRNEE